MQSQQKQAWPLAWLGFNHNNLSVWLILHMTMDVEGTHTSRHGSYSTIQCSCIKTWLFASFLQICSIYLSLSAYLELHMNKVYITYICVFKTYIVTHFRGVAWRIVYINTIAKFELNTPKNWNIMGLKNIVINLLWEKKYYRCSTPRRRLDTVQ